MVAIENTHNFHGGTVWSVDEVRAVADASDKPLFMDGARLFNAVVASGTPAADYCAPCDVVTLSLYKGLCAPMGSLVCCRGELLDDAWRFRRVFGGALRQGGVVAAAGVVALETMIDRLADDHANAKRLAAGLDVDPAGVETNMVVLHCDDSGKLLAALKEQGVLAGALSATSIRLVTHKDVDSAAIDRAIDAFRRVL
jgi:threonine aldolase